MIFQESQLVVSLYKLPIEDKDKVNPKVWGEASRIEITPIRIGIKRLEDLIKG